MLLGGLIDNLYQMAAMTGNQKMDLLLKYHPLAYFFCSVRAGHVVRLDDLHQLFLSVHHNAAFFVDGMGHPLKIEKIHLTVYGRRTGKRSDNGNFDSIAMGNYRIARIKIRHVREYFII